MTVLRHYRLRWLIRTAAAMALPVLLSCATIATATAAACPSSPAVVEIDVRGTTFFALIVLAGGQSQWAQSTDGGLTWAKGASPPGRLTKLSDTDPYFRDAVNGPLHDCTSDGTCFRVIKQSRIDRRASNGTWIVERKLTAAEIRHSNSGCSGGERGRLGSIGTSGNGSTMHVVASLGAAGVLSRTDRGAWVAVPVLAARPPVAPAIPRHAFGFGIIVIVLTGAGLGLYGRRRWPSRTTGALVYLAGSVVSVVVAATMMVIEFFELPSNANELDVGLPPIGALTSLIIWAVTVVVSILLARRPKPAPPVWLQAPPFTTPGPRPRDAPPRP